MDLILDDFCDNNSLFRLTINFHATRWENWGFYVKILSIPRELREVLQKYSSECYLRSSCTLMWAHVGEKGGINQKKQ